LGTRHKKIDTGPMSIFLCLVPNTTRVYLYVSCAHCYPCLSFCVLCPMLPVSIFLCPVSNVTRVYLSVSCVHCYPVTLDTRHRKIDTGNIGHETQKDRHGKHWTMLTVSVILCLVSNVARLYLSVYCVQCYLCL
jgi:hypothetical protein